MFDVGVAWSSCACFRSFKKMTCRRILVLFGFERLDIPSGF